jgi:hypothetical protein
MAMHRPNLGQAQAVGKNDSPATNGQWTGWAVNCIQAQI